MEMDSETKQDLLTMALLMKKAREQEEVEKSAESEVTELQKDDEQINPRHELLPLEPAVNHPSSKEELESRLVVGIKNCLASVEEFGQAEELLLAIWLLCRKDLNFDISYDHCQSRTGIHFTFDCERYFIKGIDWDYDIDNDELGEVCVKILGHEFTHHAVWDRYSDSWLDEHWINPDSDEVCDELNEVLNRRVHCGGCDEWVFEEDPFVNEFIIETALRNTTRRNHVYYLLADRKNRVYMAYDKKRDEEGAEYWQVINGWAETVALLPLGRLRVISGEECVQLLLQQELVISDGFGNSEDMIWSPKEKRLVEK